MATRLTCLELHRVVFQVSRILLIVGFQGFFKSFVDKLLSKLVKKCYRMGFFKLARFLRKSMACVKIVQWQSSISSFGMFIVCFSIARLSLSIFAFAHRQAAHSYVLCIIFSIFSPIFEFLANVGRQVIDYHLFDIPKALLSSHIFSQVCLELMYIQSLIPMCLV